MSTTKTKPRVREEWRPVVDWPKYEISSRGRLRSKHARFTKPMSPSGPEGCIPCYKLNSGGRRLHTTASFLMLRAFVGEPQPGQIAVLIDGDPKNLKLENLRWGRPSDDNGQTKKARRRFAAAGSKGRPKRAGSAPATPTTA